MADPARHSVRGASSAAAVSHYFRSRRGSSTIHSQSFHPLPAQVLEPHQKLSRQCLHRQEEDLWHSPSQKGKVRWGAKHSPPANMSTGREQMMQRNLQVGMQRQSINSLRQTKHCCKDLSHYSLACNSGAEHIAHTATHHQAINQSLCKMHQQPATQQVKEKRAARAHAHEARAAAGKICFCTSNFNSEMHPATRFLNLTHLRHTQET